MRIPASESRASCSLLLPLEFVAGPSYQFVPALTAGQIIAFSVIGDRAEI
jgi:hypothetical protein